jgi:hypothetical protein
LKQAVETASHAVVVERWQLAVDEAECLGSKPRRPFSDAVQGLAREEHVLEQERDSQRRSDSAAPVGAWEIRSEKLVEAHAFEELIDDR